ncbi:MAG: 16S rRNA (cytidine(1402)-2'-O)-methyltransferase [Clostridia bacterium]|nr:16S rRNA (cytidine(1402)-2'-O)-methyltransferase [Clostridia bacterium]
MVNTPKRQGKYIIRREINVKGKLFICPTPIGNLEDITLRVLRVLEEVDIIAAEDTRVTRKILNHYHIRNSLTSYHGHNEWQKSQELLRILKDGGDVALVSDAGTPGISDPGEKIIQAAVEEGIEIVYMPGASAFIGGLVVSGLPTDRFCFEGFLPRKKNQRKAALESLKNDTRTLIFYEAPHRVLETLRDMIEIFGCRKAALVRELTKKFEEVIRGSLEEVHECIKVRDTIKGELILIIHGADTADDMEMDPPQWKYWGVSRHVAELTEVGYGTGQAVKEVAGLRGLPRRDVYKYILESKDQI